MSSIARSLGTPGDPGSAPTALRPGRGRTAPDPTRGRGSVGRSAAARSPRGRGRSARATSPGSLPAPRVRRQARPSNGRGVGPSRAPRLRRRHFDRFRSVAKDVPEPSRRPMAGHDRLMPLDDPRRRRREDGRHAPPLPGQVVMPNPVDAPVDAPQPPRLIPVDDRAFRVPQARQLPSGHHAMLPRRQLGQFLIHSYSTLCRHTRPSVEEGDSLPPGVGI